MTSYGKVLKLDPLLAADRHSEEALLRWLIEKWQQRGATAVNVWHVGRRVGWLSALGFQKVRIYWRMDRSAIGAMADVVTREPVTLIDGASPAANMGDWVEAYNLSFEQEWQHWPETEESFRRYVKRNPKLALAALAADGRVLGVCLGQIEWFSDDPRQQPVGAALVLGVIPDKQRKGIGRALLVSLLKRFFFDDALPASIRTDIGSQFESRRLYNHVGFRRALSFYVYERRLTETAT